MQDPHPQHKAIRHEYESHGVDAFYRDRGRDYRNPHEPQIQRSLAIAVRDWPLDLTRVLDLAAGSGEVTLVLRSLGAGSIDAIDPFTFEAYEQRTGQPAGRETFEQIADGALSGRSYRLIVCSYALHLLEESRLPRLAWQLSRISPSLLLLTPHKRPVLRAAWGWKLKQEIVVDRVRSRLYESTGC
ncbi:MAG TPA: class I SAM-dependent methyltransferase [Tepidisphaeraceae bacterium]|nr:class I SAM-dependent methyltransferase [Tepidisphaeraceae bacterium]